MTFTITKATTRRTQHMSRLMISDVPAETFMTTDHMKRVLPAAGDLITDAMVAFWLRDQGPAPETPGTISESDILHLIGWYYIAHAPKADSIIAQDAEPGLHRATRPLRNSSYQDLPYTMLMVALSGLRPDTGKQFALPGDGSSDDFLAWYYLHGLVEHGLSRCLSEAERTALNTPRAMHGTGLLCILDWWALQRGGVARELSLDSVQAQLRARDIAWKLRAADPAFEPYEPPIARPIDAAKVPLHISALSVLHAPEYCFTGGKAVWFGQHADGNRLLLQGEWFLPEPTHVWAKLPIASLVFTVDQDTLPAAIRLGFTAVAYPAIDTLNQTIGVYLNGIRLAEMAALQIAAREVVLRGVDAVLNRKGPNLLQFATDKPLIPTVHLDLPDTRQLGMTLRCLWVG